MTTEEKNEKEILESCLIELRRLYDQIANTIENLRTKALALLAGEVAIVTFLFAPSASGFFSISVPIYGIVVFGLGLLLLTISFISFLAVISSLTWQHPPDEKDIKNPNKRFNNSVLECLIATKDEYMSCINYLAVKANRRSRNFMIGVYTFSAGVALLTMIKYLSNIVTLGG